MTHTLAEINNLLRNSNNKHVQHWSMRPGEHVNKLTGIALLETVENRFPGTVLEWFEILPLELDELNEEMERLALSPLSENDTRSDAYVSPDVLTIMSHLPTFQHQSISGNGPVDYTLAGTLGKRKIYVNAFHPTNLVVLVPEGPESVLGVLSVKGFFREASQETPQAPVPAHNPLEATRLEDKEPVAKTSYKTTDEAWINPKVPMADKVLRIKFKKMTETAKIPTAIRDGDIGFDLYCDENFSIASGETVKVKTNIQLADMPTMDNDRNRIFLKVEGRSGLSARGIFPTGGIIDPTYRGEIGVVLNCLSPIERTDARTVSFGKGDRIAQLVIYKVATAGEVTMEESEHVTETNRGSSGFGSSGK